MVTLYLLYLTVFAIGVMTLASSFLLFLYVGSPLSRFFLQVFAGLTMEMAVTLAVNFVLVVGLPVWAINLILFTVALGVFGMSLVLGLATATYFSFSKVGKLVLAGAHALGLALLLSTSRIDEVHQNLTTSWGGFGLFLLPLTILACLALFSRHLVLGWSESDFPRKSILVALVLGWGFLPLFSGSIAKVALTAPIRLAPGFFPMTPVAVFYLVVSLLFLWFHARPVLQPKPTREPSPNPQKWSSSFGMSPRETEVLILLLQGKDNKQIAFAMGITTATVKAHLTRMFQKTQTQSRFELVRFIEGRNSTKVE